MFWTKKVKCITALLAAAGISLLTAAGTQAYIATNRDTKLPPDKLSYDLTKLDDFELLCETDSLKYYFKEDRDVIAIEDKRSGYTWKTGIDMPFSKEADKAAKEAESAEELASIRKEIGMNSTYIAMANSLISIEYYEKETIKNLASASEKGAVSTLYTLNDNPATRMLEIDFSSIKLKMKVYLTFGDKGFSVDIPYEEIEGEGKAVLASVIVAPFLGASGGEEEVYDAEKGDFVKQSKKSIPGYVLVPDGSGSLIRFVDNTVPFIPYNGDVYGTNLSTGTYYYSMAGTAVPVKDPVMPVFGIAHGDSQAAFVAYADEGAEYMQIQVSPDENKKLKYTWAYPRFEYNMTYFQVYNKKGEGYFTMMEEPSHFDVNMTYEFLEGDGTDGTPAADYTGMAEAYRTHLIETGVLNEAKTPEKEDIPVRLDFIMSDAKKGIVGTEQVVTTDADDVGEILKDVINQGITNINSGLIGWQKDGETLAKPYQADYSGSIGSKGTFKELFSEFAGLGVDISFSRNFTSINKQMINYYGVAAKHVNTWYLDIDKENIMPVNAPVMDFGIASPVKTASWVKKLAGKVASFSSSMTLTGISNVLTGDYDRNGPVTTPTEAIALYEEALAEIQEDTKLNLEKPNMYLWKYTDRFLQAPAGGTQYLFETDTVPFLQMVLHGTMEVYAPYANFSFYTDSDILRMIDYNMYPSFILSKEPSYLLADTASAEYYSTEYTEYKELIRSLYGKVNAVLGQVAGYQWTDRTVPADGVIINSYENGESLASVVINYTEAEFVYQGTTVAPLSAAVIR